MEKETLQPNTTKRSVSKDNKKKNFSSKNTNQPLAPEIFKQSNMNQKTQYNFDIIEENLNDDEMSKKQYQQGMFKKKDNFVTNPYQKAQTKGSKKMGLKPSVNNLYEDYEEAPNMLNS